MDNYENNLKNLKSLLKGDYTKSSKKVLKGLHKELNEWLQSMEKGDKNYNALLRVFKEEYKWNELVLDELIEDSVGEFFKSLEATKKSLREEIGFLTNKLSTVFGDELSEEELFLTELKDSQLMEVKTILELFLISGDYTKLENELNTKEDFIKELNERVAGNPFYLGEDNKVKYNITAKGLIDVRYKTMGGFTYFVDVTSDTQGMIDYKEGLKFDQQPIVKHTALYEDIVDKEEGLTFENSSYSFIPNVINRRDMEYFNEQKDEYKNFRGMPKSKQLMAFLTLMSKYHHLSVLDDSINDTDLMLERNKTDFLNSNGTKITHSIDLDGYVEILKWVNDLKYNENNFKKDMSEMVKILGPLLKVAKYGEENIYRMENLLGDIKTTLDLNFFSKKTSYKILNNGYESNKITTEEMEKLYRNFESDKKINTQGLKRRIEENKEKELKEFMTNLSLKILISNLVDGQQYANLSKITDLEDFKKEYLLLVSSSMEKPEYQTLINDKEYLELLYKLDVGEFTRTSAE